VTSEGRLLASRGMAPCPSFLNPPMAARCGYWFCE